MNRRRLVPAPAALASVVGAYAAVHRYLPTVLGGAPSGVGALTGLSDVVGFFCSPVAVFALAYWLGGRLDVPREWRRVAVAFGVYGGVAFGLGFALAALALPGTGLAALPLVVAVSITAAAPHGVSFALTGVAGSAVRAFREP